MAFPNWGLRYQAPAGSARRCHVRPAVNEIAADGSLRAFLKRLELGRVLPSGTPAAVEDVCLHDLCGNEGADRRCARRFLIPVLVCRNSVARDICVAHHPSDLYNGAFWYSLPPLIWSYGATSEWLASAIDSSTAC
jgi:hypothetical protein